MTVSLSPQTTDDIVSSAECSSDDEDLEECDSGHAGGMGVSSCACAERGLFPFILSLICHRGAPPPSITPHGSFKCNFKKERKINKSSLKSSQSFESLLSVNPKSRNPLEMDKSSKNHFFYPQGL